MNECAVDNCNGPCLPNLEYCLMHRKNKPTSVPPLPIEVQAAPLNKKSMIVGSIKSNSEHTRIVDLVVSIVFFIFIGVPFLLMFGAADAAIGVFFVILMLRLVYTSAEWKTKDN